MKLFIFLALTTLVCAAPATRKKRYDGHKVLRLFVTKLEDANFLEEIREQTFLGVDFWTEPSVKRPVDIHINPESEKRFLAMLHERNIAFEIVNHNIQRDIDDEEKFNFIASLATRSGSEPAFLHTYARYNEINEWYDSMAEQYSNLASVTSIGQSYEGRDMRVLKISSGSGRPAIFLESGSHPREWISIATVNWITNELLTGYGQYDSITSLVDRFDWYILPMANPDGYEYTHRPTGDRMWRKNRKPTPGTSCVGTDINRNYDIDFGGDSDNNPCSSSYHGPSPFSENETVNERDFLLSINESLVAFVALHSYAQFILVPYGYTYVRPTDYAELERVANLSADAIQSVNGRPFTVGTVPDLLYLASGLAMDWAKDILGVKYSYSWELRPTYWYWFGFTIPPSNIEPSGREIFAGLKAMANNMIL